MAIGVNETEFEKAIGEAILKSAESHADSDEVINVLCDYIGVLMIGRYTAQERKTRVSQARWRILNPKITIG